MQIYFLWNWIIDWQIWSFFIQNRQKIEDFEIISHKLFNFILPEWICRRRLRFLKTILIFLIFCAIFTCFAWRKKSNYFTSDFAKFAKLRHKLNIETAAVRGNVTRKKLQNVYKSCPKIITLEKLKVMTPLQNLPKNVGALGKAIVDKGLKKWPKVQ